MDKFKVLNCGDHYTVVNLRGEYGNHTHLKKYNTCQLLIKLVQRKQVPNSSYLRASAKRLTLDTRYKDKIDRKILKDSDKQRYYNKGGR